MPEIRPITDLRKTSEISELCHELHEPVFITKNGYGDMVVMSMDTYERKMALVDVYKKLSEAENQLRDGNVLLDGDEVLASLREKHVRS